MNLTQLYALTLGQKIDKPFINEIFYPLPFDKYIVIQPWTKPAKNWDWWQDFVDIIIPVLNSENIQLVQVGGPKEVALNGCYHTQGMTSFNQLQYLIHHSIGYIGADSISSHIAGAFDKPLITLVSNNFIDCVQPFFGNGKNKILIEPNRNGANPSFSLQENPKSINTIEIETLLIAFEKLFNISIPKIKSLHRGEFYSNPQIDVHPNTAINPQYIPQLAPNIHIDWGEVNFHAIFQNCVHRKCVLITDKPFDLEPFKQIRPNIASIVYDISNDGGDIEFAKLLKKSGLPFRINCELGKGINTDEQISELKLKYIDINSPQFSTRQIPQIEWNKNLMYRSNRIIIKDNNRFLSKIGMEHNLIAESNHQQIPSEEFLNELLKESEYLYIYQINE